MYHHTIHQEKDFRNFCCEKQSLADQKIKTGVHLPKKFRKIKKLYNNFIKFFLEIINFSEFFWVDALQFLFSDQPDFVFHNKNSENLSPGVWYGDLNIK